MGRKILPVDIKPTTATINRITYGSLKAIVNFKNGETRDVDINNLAAYVTKLTPDGARLAAQIKETVIYAPVNICQNHVDIIDTPGLDEDKAMTEIAMNMLNNADAVLVAISVRHLFTEKEEKLVCELICNDIKNIIFVITFIDQLDDDEESYDELALSLKTRIYDKVTKKLKEDKKSQDIINKAETILNEKNIHIYGISSDLALKYCTSNQVEFLEKSRLEEFKTGLALVITAKQMENAFQKVVCYIKTVLPGLENLYNAKKHSFDDMIFAVDKHFKNFCNCCDETSKKINKMFADRDKEIIDTINLLKREKSLMARDFMAELKLMAKLLKQEGGDKDDIVTNAIAYASEAQRNRMNGAVLPEIKNKLLANLGLIIKIFESARDALSVHLNALEVQDIVNINKRVAEINAFIGIEMDSIRFEWIDGNYACDDVNDFVAELIDFSVNSLINKLNEFVEKTRMFVYKSQNSDSWHFDNIKKIAEKKKYDIDMESKVYASNYNKSLEKVKNIVKNSEQLL
ncbi:MAG: dynamin family protein [Fibromonadales bacterium]|nr:dynamin family protein [Fibromonadales bacterium]